MRVLTDENIYQPMVTMLRALGEGEAEAIALVLEQQAAVVLLDESDARWVAGVY